LPGSFVWTIALAMLVAAAPVPLPAATGTDAAVRAAIVRSVRARMGDMVEVRVEELSPRVFATPGQDLTAAPEPGARLGRSIRFSLRSRSATDSRRIGSTVGYATAVIFVAALHVRSARALDRGTVLEAADLVESRGEVGAVRMVRLPVAADMVGAVAMRPLAADEVLVGGIVSEPPMVRAGDLVLVRAVSGAVVATGEAIASQSGKRGDTIRVVNPASRRAFRARVTGPRETEVIR